MNRTVQLVRFTPRMALWAVCGMGVFLMVVSASTEAEEPVVRHDSNGDPLPPGAIARLGSARFRHGGPITGLHFSLDIQILFSGSSDRTIRLWDVASGREQGSLIGPTGRLRAIALSPDGKRLAAATQSAGIWIWDVTTGEPIHKIIKGFDEPNDLVFSPDGKLLVSTSKHSAIHLWDVDTAAEVGEFRSAKGGELKVAFAADGTHVVALDNQGLLTIWDCLKQKVVSTLPVSDECVALAISPEDQILVCTSRGPIKLYDLKTGKPTDTLQGHQKAVLDLAFSADGKTLASASKDSTVRVWDWPSQKMRSVLQGHPGEVLSVAVSHDGKIVATGGGKVRWSSDTTIRLWDANSGQELPQSNPFLGRVFSVSYSPDGKILATGTEDKRIQLWDLKTGKLRDRWSTSESTGTVAVAFTPDSKTIATVGQKVVFLTEVEDSDKSVTLGEGVLDTCCIDVSPDGKLVVCGDEEGGVSIWDLKAKKRTFSFHDHGMYVLSVAFSPNGEFIASTAWDGALCLREVKSGTLLFKQKLHNEYGRAVAFSPDNRLVASASDDKTICFVEIDSGKEVSRLQCVNGVTTIAFHPNGHTLISGHWTNQINVWDIALGVRIKQFYASPGMATGSLACSVD